MQTTGTTRTCRSIYVQGCGRCSKVAPKLASESVGKGGVSWGERARRREVGCCFVPLSLALFPLPSCLPVCVVALVLDLDAALTSLPLWRARGVGYLARAFQMDNLRRTYDIRWLTVHVLSFSPTAGFARYVYPKTGTTASFGCWSVLPHDRSMHQIVLTPSVDSVLRIRLAVVPVRSTKACRLGQGDERSWTDDDRCT